MIQCHIMSNDHVRQIALLETQCFSSPWSINSIQSELSNPLSLWLVALKDDKVVGYVGSQTVLGESDMMNLAVDPDYRHCGIASLLLTELFRMLEDRDVSDITLEVRQSNMPAISLYKKYAFFEVGRRPGYYTNPREDAIILRKELSK